MCCSPEGDLVSGAVVMAIGVDACLYRRARKKYRFVASLLILLGLHQIDESLVWRSLKGPVSAGIGPAAMWIYLMFAFDVLPVLIPALVL